MAGEAPSAAADVYSACASFLFALTRRPPFSGSIVEQLVAMRARDGEVPSSIAVISPAVASAVQAGVARRPESRPTAKELLVLLREHDRAEAHAHDDDPNQRAEYERERGSSAREASGRPSCDDRAHRQEDIV